jgi:hypothetical protein
LAPFFNLQEETMGVDNHGCLCYGTYGLAIARFADLLFCGIHVEALLAGNVLDQQLDHIEGVPTGHVLAWPPGKVWEAKRLRVVELEYVDFVREGLGALCVICVTATRPNNHSPGTTSH